MPLWGKASMFEKPVALATSESNTSENWQAIMNVTDMIQGASGPELSDAVDQMINRLRIPNPNVQLQTVKLLSSCVSNCGRPFRVALCSQAFASELRRLLLPNRGNRTHQKVQDELKKAAIEWRGNFAGDPQLHIIDTTLTDLQRSGMTLDVSSSGGDGPSSSKAAEERRQREKEEEELAMAMALSQSEAEANQNQNGPTPSASSTTKVRSAKCLYDFEATEDNELSFQAGDIVVVTNDTDPNWWCGSSQSGSDGYFPASFVTYDLNASIQKEVVKTEPDKPVIDEAKIDKCLDTLYDAMRDGSFELLTQMTGLRDECFQMEPLLDKQVSVFESAEKDLRNLNERFERAMSLFEELRDAPLAATQPPTAATYQPQPGGGWQSKPSNYALPPGGYGQPPAPAHRAVPLDSTGDGRYDTLAFDSTGDGRLDRVMPVAQNFGGSQRGPEPQRSQGGPPSSVGPGFSGPPPAHMHGQLRGSPHPGAPSSHGPPNPQMGRHGPPQGSPQMGRQGHPPHMSQSPRGPGPAPPSHMGSPMGMQQFGGSPMGSHMNAPPPRFDPQTGKPIGQPPQQGPPTSGPPPTNGPPPTSGGGFVAPGSFQAPGQF
eukprot:m.68084 g.68084  ORF g.68084 m.68084 type:complete len:601 (-) comp9900_c0_seq2:4260-6062(-)